METRKTKAVAGVLFLMVLFCAADYTAAQSDPNLLAWWRFDETSGTTAKDSAGNYDGTLINGPTWTTGIIDGALQLDGVNDCVDTGDFDLPDTFSIAMWIDPDDASDGQCFMGKHGSGGDNLFLVGFWNNGYNVQIRTVRYEEGVKATGWQHIVIVVEESGGNSDVTFYKDGVVLWNQTFAGVVAGDLAGKAWTIGQNWDGSSRTDFYGGRVYDVRIYDEALTQSEAEDLIWTPIDNSNTVLYGMGEIPSQSVWHGRQYAFVLDWEEHPFADYSMEATPEPAGELSLEPLAIPNSDLWLFTYAPAEADKHPFTVTITADDGSERFSQSFEMIPMAELPTEHVVFGNESHTQPGPLEFAAVEESVTTSMIQKSMNYGSYYPRSVRLLGERVVLKAGDESGYYDTYNGYPDIEQMEIIAETVVIGSSLHLPQTKVIIEADELRFEGSTAQIKTAPVERLQQPGMSQPGAHGLDVGSITLNVRSFFSDSSGTKFDLRGGRGQPGGAGGHGTDGADLADYWTSWEIHLNNPWPIPDVTRTFTPPSGYYLTYTARYDTCAVGIPIFKGADGVTNWPEDGTNATPPGQPGNGGNGGLFTSNIDLTAYASYTGGAAGTAARPTSYPYDRFKGGDAGFPTKSYQVKAHYCFDVGFHKIADHTSKAGTSYNLKYGSNGSATTPVTTGYSFEWLYPTLVDKLLNRAKDDYLSGRLGEAQARMKGLTADLDAYMAHPAWESLDDMERFELEEMYNHVHTLLHQIENNLDYFGNPAGWVPMLSFEANLKIFDDEIGHAIDMLYLAHWIGNQDANATEKRNALLELRDHLLDEIDRASAEYDDAVDRIPVLRNQAAEIKMRTTETILELQALEQQLENEARDELREPWWKTSMKMAGVMCKMLPVYQPVTGFIGEGLTFAAEFDANDPYGTLLKGTELVDTIIDTTVEDVATAIGVVASAATGNVGDGVKTILEEVKESKSSLTDGVKGMVDVMKGVEASQEAINAELERLKGRSEEFKALIEKIEDLHGQKVKFTRELAETILKVAGLSDLITKNLLAYDVLGPELASVQVLDRRAVMYLENLERRAFDRLLKYHYYMAKAYEYRLLEPYEEPLDLEDLLDELTRTTIGPEGNVIPQDQFNSLKAIYRDKISAVAEKIYDDYNVNPPELSAPLRFSLLPEELAAINDGQTVRLNLMDLGKFPSDEENIRIVSFKVIEIETAPVGGDYEQDAQVNLKIEHSGLSRIMSDGQTYQFHHYTEETTNPIVWGARYFPADEDVFPVEPSAAGQSLLKSLLSGDYISDMMLYSRPSAWADLEISMTTHDNAGKDIDLTHLRLELRYDFITRKQTLGLADMQVLTSTAELDDQNDLTVSVADFAPYCIVDTSDMNQRQDGRGQFHRFYIASGLTAVQVTAQQKYGGWKFNKWTDRHGNDLPGGPVTDRALIVIPSSDQTVSAQYVPGDTLAGDINNDCVVDIDDLDKMADSWLLIHPSINLDESDTEGMIDLADFAGLAADWGKTCEQVLNEASGAGAAAMSINTFNVAGPMSRVSNPRNIEWVEQ